MKYSRVSLLFTTFLPRRTVLFLRSLLPSPGCARLHCPEVKPRPFALCSRNSNGQKGRQKGWCLKMNGKEMVRCAQTSLTHLHVWMESHRDGPWWTSTTGWKPVFERGRAMIQQPVQSNRKARLSTHVNANAVYVNVFSPVKWGNMVRPCVLDKHALSVSASLLCDGTSRGYTHAGQVKFLWWTFTTK